MPMALNRVSQLAGAKTLPVQGTETMVRYVSGVVGPDRDIDPPRCGS